MLPLNNRSTNDILSLIYKSLMATPTIAILLTISFLGRGRVQTNKSLSLLGRGRVQTNLKSLINVKSLIFFLLLCNQVDWTSISLKNLNLFTIQPIPISITSITTMSNPPWLIRLLNNPNPGTPPGPPPLGFNGTGIQIKGVYTQTGVETCSFTGAATATSGSTYTVNGVVISTCAKKKIKSGICIQY